jgi:hypothetical protein
MHSRMQETGGLTNGTDGTLSVLRSLFVKMYAA